MIGLAIAGVGWLGEALIADATTMPDIRVVAIQDADLARARDVAARHHILCVVDGFESLAARADVDAVAICTPNGMHAEQAQAALVAGKHVLVQKPLALSCASAQATIDTAAATDHLLFVDYTYRFLATTQAWRQAIDQPVQAVRAVFHNIYGPGTEKQWFFDPRRSGGGALIDLGVHLLDMCLWLLAPTSVRLGQADLSGDGAVESAATLDMVCDNVPVRLEVSWNAPLPETRIGVDCELVDGGHARWENVAGSFYAFRAVHRDHVLLEAETTLRADTLRAFHAAITSHCAPPIDTRVYALLDQAYGRSA